MKNTLKIAAISILNNSIHGNEGLGIQLNGEANDSQDYPQLNLLYAWVDESDPSGTRGGIYLQGFLNGSPGETHKIQLFANSPTTNREGERFLEEIEVSTDFTGQAEIVALLLELQLYFKRPGRRNDNILLRQHIEPCQG